MSVHRLKMQSVEHFLLNKTSKYLSVAKISFSNSFVYLSNILSRSLPTVIRIWIFVQLYTITFSVSNVSEVNKLTVVSTIWILAFAQSFQGSTRPPISRIINDEVRSGELQYVISRPYSYIGFHYLSQLGRTFAFLFSNVLTAIAVALFFVGGFPFTIQGIGWGIVLLFMGITLDFLISFFIGILAFWIEDSTSLSWIYHKSQIILGGLIIPIAMFPDKIRYIAEVLPFSQMFYSPAVVMVTSDMRMVERFLLIQGFWIALFVIVNVMMFRRGIKNVSINGG